MGWLEDRQKEKRRRERQREYREKYATYVAIEEQVKAEMWKLPPDYDAVCRLLDKVEPLPDDKDLRDFYALCLAEASAAVGGLNSALRFLDPLLEEEERSKSWNVTGFAILDYVMGMLCYSNWIEAESEIDRRRQGEVAFACFQRGAGAQVPEWKPDCFKVVPALCQYMVANCYIEGTGTEQDHRLAHKILRELLDGEKIPKGYPEYEADVKLVNALEKAFRALQEAEEKASRLREEARRRAEELQRKTAQQREEYGEHYCKELKPRVEELLKRPRDWEGAYTLLKDAPEDPGGHSLLPDDGALYLAASIWHMFLKNAPKGAPGETDATEGDKGEAQKARFVRLLDGIATDSAAAWYFRAMTRGDKERDDCFQKGAESTADTNILDGLYRANCEKECADRLYAAAMRERQADGVLSSDGEENLDRAEALYLRLLRAVDRDDVQCKDVLFLWIWLCQPERPEGMEAGREALAGDVLSAALHQRALTLLKDEALAYKEIEDEGGYERYDHTLRETWDEWDDGIHNKRSDRMLLREARALLALPKESDDAVWAAALADNAGTIHKEVKECGLRMLSRALCRNGGYFLTDDRSDEQGVRTDHGRTARRAWRAAAVLDGVLG